MRPPVMRSSPRNRVPAEESARAQYHRLRGKLAPVRQRDTRRPDRRQAARPPPRLATSVRSPCSLQQPLDRRLEQLAVGLHARALHRAALGAVEHAVMDRGRIGRARDQTVEGIDFANEMALAQSTDRRIAAHRADGGKIEAHQCNTRTHARRDRSRLHTGMAAANNDDVERMHGSALQEQRIPVKAGVWMRFSVYLRNHPFLKSLGIGR